MTNAELRLASDLMRHANQVIRCLSPNNIRGPINWGDLSCTRIERVETFYGPAEDDDKEWRVIVEEAAPEASELIHAIRQGLKEHGYDDSHRIAIVTEW